MADKPKDQAPDTSPADIERRVDKMLDPAIPEETPSAPRKTIAVFHEQTDAAPEVGTAPPVAGKRVPKEPARIQVTEPKEPEAKQPTATAPEPTESKAPEPKTPAEPPSVEPSASTPLATAEESLPDTLDDDQLNQVVDEVVAEESDELLAAEDEKRAASSFQPGKPTFGERIRNFFMVWWFTPWARWGTILLVIGLLAGAGIWPVTRYMALNAVGIRSKVSLQVIDQSTLQPLKDVDIKLANQSAKTDKNGRVQLDHVRLGKTLLTVQKRAFAPINKKVTVGWGSNPLGSFNLNPVGSQYAIVVTDFLSGKPVASAAASAGDADAQSDAEGIIKLTMEHGQTVNIDVEIMADGYRSEMIKLDLNSKHQIAVKLVPARKAIFISKRSGKYDVYKVDVDGKNEQMLLAGTGNERDDMALLPHPKDDVVAIVSTRDNKRNKDGYLLSTLTMIDLRNGAAWTVAQSEQITLASWAGERLVYVQIAAGTSAANPNRQRLMAYNYKQRDNKQLTSTNYFNDVLVAAGKIYYAPSSTYQAAGVSAALFRVNPDGSGKQQLLNQEVWNLFRTSYDKLLISVPNQWYDLPLDASSATRLDSQPGSLASRVYIDSLDGKQSLWIDNRDGKGVLLLYDVGKKTDAIVRSQSGLSVPVRWISNNTIIYRVKTEQESADYALNLEGGDPVKVRDVTPTSAVDRWYYY
jgi:hypothetical protein